MGPDVVHSQVRVPGRPVFGLKCHMLRTTAHCDGKAIVPDEPLSLSEGERIEVIILPVR